MTTNTSLLAQVLSEDMHKLPVVIAKHYTVIDTDGSCVKGKKHEGRRVEQGSLTKIRGKSSQNQLFRSRLSIPGRPPSRDTLHFSDTGTYYSRSFRKKHIDSAIAD